MTSFWENIFRGSIGQQVLNIAGEKLQDGTYSNKRNKLIHRFIAGMEQIGNLDTEPHQEAMNILDVHSLEKQYNNNRKNTLGIK